MYAFFRVKLKESFTNEGILYLGNQEHLFPDRIFPKIPSFIIEDFSEFKMPIDRREQLGFSGIDHYISIPSPIRMSLTAAGFLVS